MINFLTGSSKCIRIVLCRKAGLVHDDFLERKIF